MPHMSSDQLRDISVAVVEEFINNKIPLSQGLAKQAALHELNSEQIQRCVEASNTICHLAILGKAEDRTFEFPLCKFAEVMAHAAAPDFEKSAGIMDSLRRAGRAVGNTFKDAAGKGAAAKEMEVARKGALDARKLHQGDREALKELHNSRDLAKQTGASPEFHQELRENLDAAHHNIRLSKKRLEDADTYHAMARQREEQARNKAGARITVGAAGLTAAGTAGYIGAKHVGNMQEKRASDDSAIEISEHEAKLHFIKEAAANDRAVEELEARASIVKAELIKAASAVAKDPHGLDKIACAVEPENAIALTQLAYGEYRTLRDFGAGKDGLFKAAELKTVATFQDLYKEARALVNELNERKALQKRAHAVREELQKEAVLGFAGRMIGGGIGRVVGSAAGTVAKGVKSLGKTVVEAGGKAAGVDKYKKIGLGATALAAGGTAAMNASILGHNPGVNPVNGRSRDVWDGLQSN